MLTITELRKNLGQLFLIGFDGTFLPHEVACMLRQQKIGGIILFRRNIVSVEQVAELNKQIYSLGSDQPPYPFIAVDQEGGRVSRLPEPFLQSGPFCQLGKTCSIELAYKLGQAIGNELFSLGFNLNFAPVLDVNTNKNNPVIGDRAISGDPEIVGLLGVAFAQGLVSEGIIACGKHFPGHGDTALDSHYALPVVEHDYARLEAAELKPFVAAIEQKIAALMTAHVVYPSLDKENPATLSANIITQLLRRKLGFSGVIFSDDLEMAAVTNLASSKEIAIKALQAGVDVLLFCRNFQVIIEVREAIEKALVDKKLSLAHIDAAITRVLKLKQQLRTPQFCLANLGREEHKNILRDIDAFNTK